MGEKELKDILEAHREWIKDSTKGKRANLSSANLSSANLSYANLSSANLSYANLSYADLRYANLSSANLSYANLSYANLSYANLSYADLRYANLSLIKEDFFVKMLLIKNEVVGLYDHLIRGKINGLVYEGECACFVGTIANIRKENYQSLKCDLKPDGSSPIERWFLAIQTGDTPQSNQVSKITSEWMQEFMKANEIVFPEYKLVSSLEYPEAFK